MSASEEPKVLSTKELGNVIDAVVKENVKLSDHTRLLMSRVYDRFRHQISVALKAHDASDSVMWISLIGDMMALVNDFKVDGIEKKEIVLETIRIVIRFEVPVDKKAACDVLLNTVLTPAIDLAVYFKKQFIDGKKISLGFCCSK
jgi:hypothetical protein